MAKRNERRLHRRGTERQEIVRVVDTEPQFQVAGGYRIAGYGQRAAGMGAKPRLPQGKVSRPLTTREASHPAGTTQKARSGSAGKRERKCGAS